MLYTGEEEKQKRTTIYDNYVEGSDKLNISNEVGGMSYYVDFYNNIATSDDKISVLDTGKPITLQSYREIKDVVIKLTNSLSPEEDTITGEGYINIGSKVYVNDMIVGDYRNRKAIFKVTEVLGNRFELNEITSIQFSLHTFVDNNPDAYENLLNKIATEYVYDKNFNLDNSSPIVKRDTAVEHDKLLNLYRNETNEYLRKYYNHNTKVLGTKLKDKVVLDPYLNDFVMSWADDTSLGNRLEYISTVEDRDYRYTIFSAILDTVKVTNIPDKLKFTHTGNSPYLKVMLKAERLVGISDARPIEEIGYFLEDEFYSFKKREDKFENTLLDYLTTRKLNIENIKELLELEDEFEYFRKPILLYMLKMYCLMLRR